MAQAVYETSISATTRAQIETMAGALATEGKLYTLIGLFDAFMHVADALSGFANQPRLDDEPANGFLEIEVQRFSWMAEIVIQAIERTEMSASFDRDARGEALVRWAFYLGASLEEAMVTLANAAAAPTTKPN
jgi:hypothetical protein